MVGPCAVDLEYDSGWAGRKKGRPARERGREDRKKFTKYFCFALRARYFVSTPHTAGQIDHLSTKSQPVLNGLDPSTVAPEGFEWYR